MSGGGTAGHIYPAIATADKFRALGHDVEFVGTPNGLESTLVAEAGIPFVALPAAGFNRARPWTLVTSGLETLISAVRAWVRFGIPDTRPDVVVGFGGYVSVPVGLAATWRGIPLVLHEQNSVPGLTNRILAPRAHTVCVTYPDTADIVRSRAPKAAVSHTGNPVRESVLSASRTSGRVALGLSEDDVLLLVFGGSRGARHLNESMVRIAPTILADGQVTVVHATGPAEYARVTQALGAIAAPAARYRVHDYIADMGNVMAAADLVVCRAGATTIAELTALGKPAILVPYPYATDDHQTANAAAMVREGAAIAFADHSLDGHEFGDAVARLLADPQARDTMSHASKALGRADAADRLAAHVLQAAAR